jgi:uncharacterized membrane-anchored protein
MIENMNVILSIERIVTKDKDTMYTKAILQHYSWGV